MNNNISGKIWSKAISKGKKISRKLYNECDGSYVGAEQDEIIEIDGKKYTISIIAFWEKNNHFDCSVKGLDNEYNKFKCCNSF